MAQVTVKQPPNGWGSLEILSSVLNRYTVQWVPPANVFVANMIEFQRNSVFCHACSGTVLSSAANPSVFDLTNLESSGHPGPFDISAVLKGYWQFYLTTEPDDPTMGTTSPDEVSEDYREIADGTSSISVTITATPFQGYRFVRWECTERPGWSSNQASLTITTGPVTVPTRVVRSYIAYFTNVQCAVNLYFRTGAVHNHTVNQRTDPDDPAYKVLYVGEWMGEDFHEVAYLSSQGTYDGGSVQTFTCELTEYGISEGFYCTFWSDRGDSLYKPITYGSSLTITIPESTSQGYFCYVTDSRLVELTVVYGTSGLYGSASLSGSGVGAITREADRYITGDRGESIFRCLYTVRYYTQERLDNIKLTVKRTTDVSRKDGAWYGGYHGYKVGARPAVGNWIQFTDTSPAFGSVIETVNGPIQESDFVLGQILKIVVYMCSHALMYNDDSGSLEYKPSNNRLIYECYRHDDESSQG